MWNWETRVLGSVSTIWVLLELLFDEYQKTINLFKKPLVSSSKVGWDNTEEEANVVKLSNAYLKAN